MIKRRFEVVNPSSCGILEYRLSDEEMGFVWKAIENKQEDVRYNLAGNISGSYHLLDPKDTLYNNLLKELIKSYQRQFADLGDFPPGEDPYYLERWWVNYQNKNEFNPVHHHGGVYSFVIWMKIPIEWEDQNENALKKEPSLSKVVTNTPSASSFAFQYTDMIGRICNHEYRLGKKDEGRMVFFPSTLKHCVYPFYDCDEPRISVSGNIRVKTENPNRYQA
tara:strand:- start:614 stop:1276 length:663 start_codon:yes stop_codon:yes gene_type:complete